MGKKKAGRRRRQGLSRLRRKGRREKKGRGSAAGGGEDSVEFFSEKVPMDLRRRREIKGKKGIIIKGKEKKRFVTNLATKG